MTSWMSRVHQRGSMIADQLASIRLAEQTQEVDLSGLAEFYTNQLHQLYEDELPLAKILDTSDLVLHAKGPATLDDNPGLKAFNWLCSAAEKNIRLLGRSVFDLGEKDAKIFSRKLDLRFNGFAPGSIYAGFSLSEQKQILDSDEKEYIYDRLLPILTSLPELPRFIKNDGVSSEIDELCPDPAYRDAALEAVLGLAPTGRNGIDEVNLSSKGVKASTLHKEDRSILRKALSEPKKQIKNQGRFSGNIREIDLDAGRFHLRNVQGIGTIRCIVNKINIRQARAMLGKDVLVEGYYETDREGRPRLMYTDSIHLLPEPEQTQII